MPPTPDGHRSFCPLAATLDLVGDKWTLIIIRDLIFRRCKRYSDFLDGPEGITTNILADRLKRMEAEGLIESEPYTQRPLRYEYHITQKGAELLPVLIAVSKWGLRYIEGTWMPDDKFIKDAVRRLRRQFPGIEI